MSAELYIHISVFVILCCFIISVRLFMKRDENRPLACCMLCAGIVNLGYLGSLLFKDYRMISICNSVYFYTIDIMLLFLCRFIDRYVHSKEIGPIRIFKFSMLSYTILEGFVFAFNAMQPQGQELAISYIYNPNSLQYIYDVKLLYTLHLIYTYVLVLYVLVRLIVSTMQTPRVYRRRYSSMLYGVLFVVALNGVYLYMAQDLMYDISLFFYGVMGLIFTVQIYHYSRRGMLTQAREAILKDLGHPLVMFDYEDRFCLLNDKAEFLIPKEKQNYRYTLQELLHDTGMDSAAVQDPDGEGAFLWTWRTEEKQTIYRCDLHTLRDHKDRPIGRVLSLTDDSLDTDLLTGFHTRRCFERTFASREAEKYPASVIVCDLNRLSVINDVSGRLAGDHAIRLLSELMRTHLRSSDYLVRFGDANLLAVCPGLGAVEAHERLDQISAELQTHDVNGTKLEMQSAVHTATGMEKDIVQAAWRAMESMRIKKLLDHSSTHASLLDSLARTQMENDPTTEAHVRRTQQAGEALGRRMGLSDADLSHLSLLCLLHDIGKLAVPLEILNKPGRLSKEEWSIMASHVVKGYHICMACRELEGIAQDVLHHHESWDGSGYPDRLSGEAIPVLCRIIAVVDAYDAMTHDRPYRKSLPEAQARQELRAFAGKQFDPNIVSEYLGMLEETAPLAEGESVARMPVLDATNRLVPDMENLRDVQNVHEVEYACYTLDENNCIIQADDAFCRMSGYTHEDISEYHLTQFDMIPQEDHEEYQGALQKLNGRDELYLEHRLKRKDTSTINVFCFGRVYYSAAVHAVRSEIVLCDASASIAVREKMREMQQSHERAVKVYQAQLKTEPLTGLYNQRAFREETQLLLLDGEASVMMMMMDIDRFKQYNDTRGHMQGDELLRLVGKTIMDLIGENEIACRMGGDEFSILLFDKKGDKERLSMRAEELFSRMRHGMQALDSGLHFSGGTALAESGMTYRQLFEDADHKLYEAKRLGRDQLYSG